jgi:tellurite resistance protein TehA-like permease
MNRSKPFTWIASAIFAVMAVAHIYRLIRPFDVTIASWNVPQWVSAVAAVITAVLSWMLCREARGTSGP